MFSFCYHSEIFKIYKCIPPEILLYCIFKFCQLGDGIIVFYPIGNRVSSQPVLLLDVSSVTQLTRSRDPFGGEKCFYFSQAGCQAQYQLGATLGKLKGSLIWLSSFNLAQFDRKCFLGGWRSKRNSWPLSTPVYVAYFMFSVYTIVYPCFLLLLLLLLACR